MTSSPKKPEEGAERKLERQFIIERQGRPFVLMAGLLDLAHQDGLDVIETHLIQTADDENGLVYQFRALVHTSRGTFTGHGSAGPANVSRMMLTHTLELAETRAIGRALRFATNIGMTTIEELGDDPIPGETETQPTPVAQPIVPRAQQQPTRPPQAPTTPVPPPKPPPPAPKEISEAGLPQEAPAAEPLTERQLGTIYTIGRREHRFSDPETNEMCIAVYGVRPSELSKVQASQFITNMQNKARA